MTVNTTLARVQIPKLVVFDVDGTLIDFDGSIQPRTVAVLARLRADGIPIVLATGRPMAIAAHTINQVEGADWMVCGNGSVVFEVATGVLIRDRCLPTDMVEPMVERLRERLPGIGFAIELADSILEEAGFAGRVPEPSTAPPVDDALAAWRAHRHPVRRIIPFHDDYDDRLYELGAIVSEFVDERCDVHAFGGLPIVDVSPAGDDKAVALQELIEHLGIEASDVVAFGDGLNDIEMLSWAGTGVAMGNANTQVQQVADHVTESISDSGVAVFLEPLLSLD